MLINVIETRYFQYDLYLLTYYQLLTTNFNQKTVARGTPLNFHLPASLWTLQCEGGYWLLRWSQLSTQGGVGGHNWVKFGPRNC